MTNLTNTNISFDELYSSCDVWLCRAFDARDNSKVEDICNRRAEALMAEGERRARVRRATGLSGPYWGRL